MIEMGLIVAVGLIAMFCKLGWRARLRMLSHPLALDIVVFILVSAHWGTYSGMMVAAIAALTAACAFPWVERFGFIKDGSYIPGRINVERLL
jgi:hypothetical protein